MSSATATERFTTVIVAGREDIDLFDHVNNVVSLRWVQEVSTAHWQARATEEEKASIGWVVVRHEIDYLNAARLGDEIIARTWVGVAKKNIFERHVEFVRPGDGKIIARAKTFWCPIDLRSLRPIRVGKEIHRRFSCADEKE